MLKLRRPTVVLDIESTGPDPVKDYIVEMGVLIIEPSGAQREWRQRFKPPVPIPPEATAVHHITDADVADCPSFDDWAGRIRAALQGKDLIVYNGWRFDLIIVDEELRRAGYSLCLDDVLVIDAYAIFAKKKPRTLSDAVREFCGREHEGAHGALEDAKATADVLAGQLAAFPDLAAMPIEELAQFSRMQEGRIADLAGKLYYDPQEVLRYAFGKHKDAAVLDEKGYANWMLGCWNPPFPQSTCDLLRQVLGYPPGDEDPGHEPVDLEPAAFGGDFEKGEGAHG